MSELFLEEVDQVLDNWSVVRNDGPIRDAMRWAPDGAPREEICSCFWCLLVDQVTEQLRLELEDLEQAAVRMIVHHCTEPAPRRHSRRSKPERRAARREALAMSRRPIVYDARTDTYILPDGCRVDRATADRNLQRAFDSLDPFSYPLPTPGAAEYHRRRRARARRRR